MRCGGGREWHVLRSNSPWQEETGGKNFFSDLGEKPRGDIGFSVLTSFYFSIDQVVSVLPVAFFGGLKF